MTKNEKLVCLFETIGTDSKSKSDIYDILCNLELFSDLVSDIMEGRYFTTDGRFEDIVLKIIDKSIKDNSRLCTYDELLSQINVEMKELVVPTIILLPLVLIEGNFEKPQITFNNSNFVLFSFLQSGKKVEDNKRYLR